MSLVPDRRLKFIVALVEHRHLGSVFVPYLVEPLQSYYSIQIHLREENLGQLQYAFSDTEKEIIRLVSRCTDAKVAAKFSRDMNSSEFFTQISPEFFNEHVRPFVEKHMYAVARILMNNPVPLFAKEIKYSNLYDEDRIEVPEFYSEVKFSFARNTTGTDYHLRVFHGEENLKLLNRQIRVVVHDPCILLYRSRLLIFKDIDAKKIFPFLTHEKIHIPSSVEPKYYRNFVLNILKNHDADTDGFTVTDKWENMQPILCLEESIRRRPVFVMRFRYGDTEILQNDSRSVLVTLRIEDNNFHFTRNFRHHPGEKSIIGKLKEKGLSEEPGGLELPGISLMEERDALHVMVTWLSIHHNFLRDCDIEIRQAYYPQKFFTGSSQVTFDIKQTKDWFDLYAMVIFGEFRFPFLNLRKYILNGIREFVLPNGEVALLPVEWFSKYRQIAQFGKVSGDKLLFSRHHFRMLKEGIGANTALPVDNLMKAFEMASEVEVPADLTATLRTYQVSGYQWMYTLVTNGLGGCLADDMGLGKTLQALALLLKLRRREQNPMYSIPHRQNGQLTLFDQPADMPKNWQNASLIVVPTSLVHNWVNEIRKFAPNLSYYVHTGISRNKNGTLASEVVRRDLIITTYGTLRNDVELFSKLQFFLVLLDESQYIKNRSSKTYSAVMALEASHRMVLTGTPIENSLSDLWAQMNFVNKGLLGNYAFFRQNYQVPVENRSEENIEEKLQNLIRPFVLRRTKAEVARDLPPVMEEIIVCPMAPDQQEAYEKEKTQLRNAIISSIESRGTAQSSLVILQGLTRLRQLANHPSLVKDEEVSGSGKFSYIMEALTNLIAERHKVLIFSSFVTHLQILRKSIEEEGWKYSWLTGSTRNREEVIRQFQQEGDDHIFLISLKAGGVGLNLTRADYVFIIDPWWNPAAENQAISRAHRIGQDKHVFVYRFISENTIEEKIQLLKERKSALADKFINSNNPFHTITKEEVSSLFE